MSGARPVRHIVAVINSLEGGGAERVLCTLIGRWADSPGWKVTLVLLDDLPRRYPVPGGVAVRVLDARQSLLRSVVGLAQTLPQLRPDVVLSFLTRSNLASIAVGLPQSMAVVVSERVNTSSHFSAAGWRGWVSRWLVRLLYPHATHVLAVSAGVAADLKARFRVAANRLGVIENPYNIKELGRLACEHTTAILPQRFIVAVGRLTANKNHQLLLRALAQLNEDVYLVVLGEGDELTNLQALAAALQVERRVRFLGHVANPHAIVSRALAYVSASNAEGFPNAAAEAMVLGVPVVMTDCPSGPAELLGCREGSATENGNAPHGWLVPMNDADAMVAALREVLAGRDTADRVRLAQRRMQAFDVEHIASRYLSVLDEVVMRHSVELGRRG